RHAGRIASSQHHPYLRRPPSALDGAMANLADELRVERRPHANSEDPRRARTHQNAHRAKPNAASVQRRPPSSTAAGVTLSGRTSPSTKPGVNAILSTRACPAQRTPSPECTITRQALTSVTANGAPTGPGSPSRKRARMAKERKLTARPTPQRAAGAAR